MKRMPEQNSSLMNVKSVFIKIVTSKQCLPNHLLISFLPAIFFQVGCVYSEGVSTVVNL